MCGIVAAVASNNIVPVLIEELNKLEYRGYDSAGLAIIGQNSIERLRSVGCVAELASLAKNTSAKTGIAEVVALTGQSLERKMEWFELLKAQIEPRPMEVGETSTEGKSDS
jgi:glucosamine 6-phosphate synthetase-like amidotransferase/phosphosugar isomerase protein